MSREMCPDDVKHLHVTAVRASHMARLAHCPRTRTSRVSLGGRSGHSDARWEVHYCHQHGVEEHCGPALTWHIGRTAVMALGDMSSEARVSHLILVSPTQNAHLQPTTSGVL
jgi:hypothetical protein